MKCFNHSSSDAVGVCKSCGRALCRECVTEVGLSLSCKDRCETVVGTMNDLVERGSTAYQKTSASYLRSGILVSLLGLIFFVLGVFGLLGGDRGPWAVLIAVMGLLFLGMGVSSLISARRFKQK